MSASLDAAFANIVRGYLYGLDRDAGTAPAIPESKDSVAPAIHDMGNAIGSSRTESGSSRTLPDAQATGPAYRNAPNAYGWLPQTQQEMLAYRESYSDLGTIAVGATATINPNEATNFLITASGNLTIAVGAPAAPPNIDPGAPTPQYLLGLKVWLYRPKGTVVTWLNVTWSIDVTNPAGDGSKPSLLAAAPADGWDSYVLVVFPGRGTFGYLAGRAYPNLATSS